MAKQHDTRTKTVRAVPGAVVARAVDPVVEFADSGSVLDHEQMAQLAYFYWQARGCPVGSPEEDWFKAEAALRKPAARAAAST